MSRRAETFRRIESEIAGEKAAALGRAGERLEEAMREVTALAVRLARLADGPARLALGEAYEAARMRALHARLSLLIQREALGLRGHAAVDQAFPEPVPFSRLPASS